MSASFDNDPEFSDAPPKRHFVHRFTLFHLIVFVGILGILIGLLIPARRTARGAARRLQCQSNLKQVGVALVSYAQTYNALPPAYTVDASGRPLHSWRTLILPYLDNEDLYRTIDLTKPWNDPANAKALETSISVFRCPATDGPKNTTPFLAIVAPKGCLLPGRPRPLTDITDPHAQTLMVIEVDKDHAVPWMAPVDADESLIMSLSPTAKLNHAGGMNFLFVDGGVRYLSAELPAETRRAIISISGNDVLPLADLE